ncbi:hypothetical protein FB451DRAFT_147298 [Mycena latifolia]|nr:hypothetical protein FB451DRAFT_147298 [Mycena latifolia]
MVHLKTLVLRPHLRSSPPRAPLLQRYPCVASPLFISFIHIMPFSVLTIHGMIPPLSPLATLPLHRPHNSLGHRQRGRVPRQPPLSRPLAPSPRFKSTWGTDAKEVAKNANKINATWLEHAFFLVEVPSHRRRSHRMHTPPPYSVDTTIQPRLPNTRTSLKSRQWSFHTTTTTAACPHKPPCLQPPRHTSSPPSGTLRTPADPASPRCTCTASNVRRVPPTSPRCSQSSFDVTLMPGEHFTAIRDPPPPTVYFTGDTSYRPMPFSTDDGPEILPVSPAFKDSGDAYAQQRFMSPIHHDIHAKRAPRMYCRVWVPATEDMPRATCTAREGVRHGGDQ